MRKNGGENRSLLARLGVAALSRKGRGGAAAAFGMSR
jgi:hypothetical protein